MIPEALAHLLSNDHGEWTLLSTWLADNLPALRMLMMRFWR